MNNEIKKYNDMLKEEYGEEITVKIKSYTDDDGSEVYYYSSMLEGESDDFDTAEDAYYDACIYLDYQI